MRRGYPGPPRARPPPRAVGRVRRLRRALLVGAPRGPAVGAPARRGPAESVESHDVPASVALPVPDLTDGFLALGLALVVSLLATPVAGALAWRIGAIDMPRERGLHQFPTPRLGGLAILAAVVAAGPGVLPPNPGTTPPPIRAPGGALAGAPRPPLALSPPLN